MSTTEKKIMCMKWLEDPLVNPETGKIIKKNGETYNKWKNLCLEMGIKPQKPENMTKGIYKNFQHNDGVNPITGRKIKKDGPTYRKLQQQSQKFVYVERLDGEYYIPDVNGYVPVVISKGRLYAMRLVTPGKDNSSNNHKTAEYNVYGPNNRLTASQVKTIVHYTQTWDYKNNKYKPMFLGKKPPIPANVLPIQLSESGWLDGWKGWDAHAKSLTSLLKQTGIINEKKNKCPTADLVYNKVLSVLGNV